MARVRRSTRKTSRIVKKKIYKPRTQIVYRRKRISSKAYAEAVARGRKAVVQRMAERNARLYKKAL